MNKLINANGTVSLRVDQRISYFDRDRNLIACGGIYLIILLYLCNCRFCDASSRNMVCRVWTTI